jgi:uncharacterized small protein (DUF1192 family)
MYELYSSEQYWQPGLFEIEQVLGKTELLGRIGLISAEIQQRQLDLAETVAGARAAGATWRDIGGSQRYVGPGRPAAVSSVKWSV